MESTTKLILVRHGESEGNRDRRFTPTPAVPLTVLGREQARRAASRIALGFRPYKVLSSPYTRARQTAEIIAQELGVDLEIEEHFHEQKMGEMAGRPYDVVHDDPTFDRKRVWLWRPPGGESREEVRLRVGPVLDRLGAGHRGRELVIVSHGGVMSALWAHVTGSWHGAHVPPNCGIVLVEYNGQGYRVPPEVIDWGIGEEQAGPSGGSGAIA